jgi:SAM-dependent methyltransferase
MQKNINKYLSSLLEAQKIEMLSIALELELFRLIDEKVDTLDELVKHLDSDSENTKVLLNTLVYLELIKYKEGAYKNTPFTKKFFIYGDKNYSGDIFLYRKELLNSARKMFKSLIMNGNKKIKDSKHPDKWAEAARQNLKQEQKVLIAPFALDIIKKLPEFNSFSKILDLGCSSGIVGLELIKEHKSAKGVCFDYKEVIQVVKEHIKEYDLEDRVSTLSGDIELDDIGSGYDLIWCSNLFYFIKEKKELFQKIYKALNKGGVLVSTHIQIDEKDHLDEASFFYYLFLNLQGKEYLETKSLNELFIDSGFSDISTYTSFDFPMTPLQVQILRK